MSERVVLDTNVLVSASLVQGSVADQVLDTVLAGRSRVVGCGGRRGRCARHRKHQAFCDFEGPVGRSHTDPSSVSRLAREAVRDLE